MRRTALVHAVPLPTAPPGLFVAVGGRTARILFLLRRYVLHGNEFTAVGRPLAPPLRAAARRYRTKDGRGRRPSKTGTGTKTKTQPAAAAVAKAKSRNPELLVLLLEY